MNNISYFNNPTSNWRERFSQLMHTIPGQQYLSADPKSDKPWNHFGNCPVYKGDRVELSHLPDREHVSPIPPTDLRKASDGRYSYLRKTDVRIGLKLKFSFRAVKALAGEVASGEKDATEALTELVKGQLGLSTQFYADGREVIEEHYGNGQGSTHIQPHNMDQASMHGKQWNRLTGRDGFNSRIMYKESESVRESLWRVVRDNFTHTVRSFSMRYSRDVNFEFSHFSRFLDQTAKMNGLAPEQLDKYFDGTKAVVDSGTSEEVKKFFDVVDEFLSGSEDQLVKVADRFFDDLSLRTGLPRNMIEFARGEIKSTIDNFFNRVDAAMSGITNDIIPTETKIAPVSEVATDKIDVEA